MLLRLSKDPAARDLELLVAVARERGYDARFLDGGKRLVELVPRAGIGQPGDRAAFEDRAVVEAVIDDSDAPSLTSRGRRGEDTVVRVGAARIGGGAVGIIAGPCSVEDETRLLEIALRVRAAGAVVLRGGAYKPRPSPYAVQGLGEAGHDALARVKAETGLAVVTEVLDPRDVERVGAGADMLQSGSRSKSNAPQRVEAGRSGLPVLQKRGIAAPVRAFLSAAEYVLHPTILNTMWPAVRALLK
jgi:3-deoxy-7-phosphoheptulonate synthase